MVDYTKNDSLKDTSIVSSTTNVNEKLTEIRG